MKKSLSQHLNVRKVGSPQFAHDDNRLYFLTDLTGEMELWSMSRPGMWPERETFLESNIRKYELCPDNRHIAVSAAPDGARRQLFAFDTDGHGRMQLTDNPETIHNWGGWRRDGKRYAFSANRSRSDAYDVITKEFPSGEEQVIRTGDPSRLLSPLGWGPDGERLLMREMHSNHNHDLYVMTVESGDLTRITDGPSSETRYGSVNWHPDGDSLLLVTDYNSGWQYVARLDIPSGSVETVTRQNSNLKDLDVDWSSGNLVYRTRRDALSRVETAELVGPTTIGEPSTIDVPAGDTRSVAIGPEGDQIAVAQVPVDGKPDIFVSDTEGGGTTRWTNVSTPVALDEYKIPERINFQSHDGLEIQSFFTTPPSDDGGPIPAVIHLHAGPRQKNSPACDPIRQAFVEQGYARFEPEYRGSSGHGRRFMALDDGERRIDAIRDVAAAADWLADRSKIDEDAIFLNGRSYGGFLTMAAMARHPERFAGGVAAAPVTDFVAYLEEMSPWKRENRETEYGSLDHDRELLERISPVSDLDQVESPLLVVHGSKDRVVSPKQTKLVAEAVDESDPISVEIVEGADHLFGPQQARVDLFEQTISFFDRIVSKTDT